MHLCFDLDITLIYWLVNPIKQAAINLCLQDYPKQYDFEFSNLTEEHRQEIFRLFKSSDFMGPQNVVYDVRDKFALNFWKSKGHKLYLVTSRNGVDESTNMIIDSYFKNIFDKVIICDGLEAKAQHFIDNKIDVSIDDAPKCIEISMDLGIKTFMIFNHITCCYNNQTLLEYVGRPNFKYVRSVYEIWKGKMI